MGPMAVRPVLGLQNIGDIPPSTFAAQIVDNLTKSNQQSKPDDQESFRLLLLEILGTGGKDGQYAEAVETDINVNYRLIYVVVRAGLEALPQDNPFELLNDSISQVLNCLAVIDLTIRRSPDVLFFFPQERDPKFKPSGPLFLWLIPRLLNMLDFNGDSRVRLGVLQIFRTALIAQKRVPSPGLRLRSIVRYVQGCVKDLLVFFETYGFDHDVGHGILNLTIPTLETISDVCPRQLQASDLQTILQINIKGSSKGVSILLHLLSTLVTPLPTRSTWMRNKDLTFSDHAWVTECFTRLWHKVTLGGTLMKIDQVPTNFLVLLLDTLRHYLSYTIGLINELLTTSSTAILLCHITGAALRLGPDLLVPTLRRTLCLSLFDLAFPLQKSLSVLESFHEHLLPALHGMRDDCNGFDGSGHDLQLAISLALDFLGHENSDIYRARYCGQNASFQDPVLQQAYHKHLHLGESISQSTDVDRPSKRPRLSLTDGSSAGIDVWSELVERLYGLLGSPKATDLHGLRHIAVTYYSNLSDDDQCSVYAVFGQMACAGARGLSSPLAGNDKMHSLWQCSVCDVPQARRLSKETWEGSDSEELFLVAAKLVKMQHLQRATGPRVAAMAAIKRLLSHTKDVTYLDLNTSAFGQWCLRALRSSMRELRIAAGRTLPMFLQNDIDEGILRSNCVLALASLRAISEKSELPLQETCILAWGQILHVSNDVETNIVLLRLVEYLGHTNPLICGLAYDELQRICNHSSFSAMRLFTPYWRTVAVEVVRNLQSRPQIAQQMSDLLAMTVPEFLRLTQFYTIPFLVYNKKRELLQRISDACDPGCSIRSLCMEHTNMAAIIAFILLRPSTDMEGVIMALLTYLTPDFDNIDFSELAKIEPILTASELLKTAGEENDTQRAQAHQALLFLAGLTHGKSGPIKGLARKADVVGLFFESFVLGIMAQLSDTINDGKGPQPLTEKKRCLGAIREMIRTAKSHISNGLPQICACLRSAIDNKELCNEAFAGWMIMIEILSEEDIESLVDPTFAIIAQHWESFSSKVQGQACDMVSQLLKSHTALVRDIVNTIPSLASIPLMSKFEEELGRFKAQMDVKHQYQAFSQRCQNENVTVVTRGLTELEAFLSQHQIFLHEAAISEQPDVVVSQLTRSILDACVRFNESHADISVLCARCLGLIGCLDPTRIEAIREKKEMLVLSNFSKADETIDFVVFFLEEVLVKAFLSAINTRAQGFLAYAMQELLHFADIDTSVTFRSHDIQSNANYRRWVAIPESVRNTLTPFLTSKYIVTAGMLQPKCTFPLFNTNISHGQWLRNLVFDLLQKGCGENPQMIFPVCSRVIRGQDISISAFLLPFAALNIIVGGIEQQSLEVGGELLTVLRCPLPEGSGSARENMILCSQNVFQVLDYLSRWIQEKKKEIADSKTTAIRDGRTLSESDYEMDTAQIQSVETVLTMIPAEVISQRAVDCRSYARALFHWEQYIRQQKDKKDSRLEPLYERLQEIYTHIDEPDGIEGISSHLQVLNIDQQILEHRKAGRWTAAQSWYELLLTERPNDLNVQFDLLTSLKESGQHDVLLNQVEGFQHLQASASLSLPFATEASWVTGKWDKLEKFLCNYPGPSDGDFNVGIGKALLALSQNHVDRFTVVLDKLRHDTARSLSTSSTTSLQACHDAMLRFHVITEVEAISGVQDTDKVEISTLMMSLNRRLNVLGVYLSDKQYLLGLRRAAMQLSKCKFSDMDIASAWLTSAKLARKGDFTHQAFNAVLHASQLGDKSATIEHSRLLWREGQHRKAIQSLEGAIAANAFSSHDYTQNDESTTSMDQARQQHQNLLTARAHLLLAKWIDRAGQTQSDIIIRRYKMAVECHNRWEKGHYYLGKHYNKLLESEKAKPPEKQAQTFITGETAKLVIENYLRSLAFGAKYIYQTLPRILTLWLELGSNAEEPLDPKCGTEEEFRKHVIAQRPKLLGAVNSQLKKYIDRLPAFVFYTALSQIVARICHTSPAIYASLVDIVAKVVLTHPQQALWTLLAIVKSSSMDRARRGAACMNKVLENSKRARNESVAAELRTLVTRGQRLSAELLRVCEGDVQGKSVIINIKELGFSHRNTPCRLVIPLEATLAASLPTVTDNVNMKSHKAFTKDTVTISTFRDDVFVLSSLQRPRKISILGSDGHVYSLLCKPKDDLRKDQRLMEFNAMINRSLKRDAESSKRRLYIKTYAVTPLNEECGLIEWVDNLKTLREILLSSYKQKNIIINYGELRTLLDEAISGAGKLPIFIEKVLAGFPPVFHEWFVEMFPEPGAWFAARLRYTRSCAVMSMVGHVLGLGDRHGENILFEEGNGGTFHVDFNCLFDKGLTFEKPELVPFRLTHNMVDAFGAYGYHGPFRKSCELTLGILRQNEDTLMTILETFVYDPTTDFIGKKKKNTHNVPDTPRGVLESVRNKVRGLLPLESVPLSVEGHVEELIQQATEPLRLASMYIGWCAFF